MSPLQSASIRIASRGSPLALAQARMVRDQLAAAHGIDPQTMEIRVIRTSGDVIQDRPLAEVGSKGLFTKEIEQALLDGAIDIAVHSLKDLPTEITPGLAIAAVPEREDPRDALVGSTFAGLKQGARVGTSSSRRAAQLRYLRADLLIEPVRGNVDTRLRKLKEGQYDAIVLAAAGLKRLALDREIAEILSSEQICPAPGQGALGIQTRANDTTEEICRALDHHDSRLAVQAERAVLSGLGGGCQLPVGAFAQKTDNIWSLRAVVISPDGSRLLREQASGETGLMDLAKNIVQRLMERGACAILAQSK